MIQKLGFYYNFHRYYSPEIGRYLREDEVRGKWDFNLYVYVGGNPVMNVDNRGELSWGDWLDTILCFRYWGKAAQCMKKCQDEWEKCIEEEGKKAKIGDNANGTVCCSEKWKKKYNIKDNTAGLGGEAEIKACYTACMNGISGAGKCADFLWVFGFMWGL